MDKFLFLRSLKGSPLSIIFCFLLFKDDPDITFNETFFCKSTGYSANTIRSSLSLLVDNSIVYRVSRYGGYSLNFDFLSLLNTTTTISSDNIFSECVNKPAAVFAVRSSNFDAPDRSVNNNFYHSDIKNEVLFYLKSVGVGEPMCSFLSTLDHATLDYVTAHFDRGMSSGDPIGLIIHRIRSCDPAPAIVSVVDNYRRSWANTKD